jgi:hypothetical protein
MNEWRLAIALIVVRVSTGLCANPQPTQAPASRLDPIDGVVDAFLTHQVVMLPGGHGSKPFHDLVLSLLRDQRIQAPH